MARAQVLPEVHRAGTRLDPGQEETLETEDAGLGGRGGKDGGPGGRWGGRASGEGP